MTISGHFIRVVCSAGNENQLLVEVRVQWWCYCHPPLMGPRTCMKTSYVLEMQHFLGYQIKTNWTELSLST